MALQDGESAGPPADLHVPVCGFTPQTSNRPPLSHAAAILTSISISLIHHRATLQLLQLTAANGS